MHNPLEVSSVALHVNDSSQVGEARRAAKRSGILGGFSEEDAGRLALVVSEAASNLVKHAHGGQILIQSVAGGNGTRGFEVLVLDHGPGIRDLAESMRDGFSTAGSLGHGLGAIERASDFFEAYSRQEYGTAILCRVLSSTSTDEKRRGFAIGGVCVTMPGETVCGDAWAMHADRNRLLILVSDGLGHGASAHEASLEAVRTFRERGALPPAEILERIHDSLKSTRGAAAAVAEIDWDRRQLNFAGVGNIACAILSGKERRNAVSHHGTLGHQVRKFQEFSYPWINDGILVICSDGLESKWSIERYPGLATHHPSLIAGVLYRDFARNRDDTSVVVVKEDYLRESTAS